MDDMVEEVKRTAALIAQTSHSMDLERYKEKWLPLRYPNKGLRYMAEKGAMFEVYHEQFDLPSFFKSAAGQTVETVVDYYGSTHQRDYCLIVLGHRFQGRQTVQFRGILGQNRLYKILLLLYLAGVPESQIVLYDGKPDYHTIVSHDLNFLSDLFDHVVFGGDVIIKLFLSPQFTPLFSARGEIVSWSIFQHGQRKILFTSYPYGDLSEYVVGALSSRIKRAITFVGSAGALTMDFSIGEIILPASIHNDTHSLITANFPNYLINSEKVGVKISSKHLSVKTPLVETIEMLSGLRNNGYTSVDVETAHFQRGCERHLADHIKVGVILFVSDSPGSTSDLSQHDYSSTRSLDIRRRLAQIVAQIVEEI